MVEMSTASYNYCLALLFEWFYYLNVSKLIYALLLFIFTLSFIHTLIKNSKAQNTLLMIPFDPRLSQFAYISHSIHKKPALYNF